MKMNGYEKCKAIYERKIEILSELKNYCLDTEIYLHLKEMIDYNVSNGKMIRSLCFIEAVEIINQTIEQPLILEKVTRLGLIIEFIQSYFLIIDDIMDQSITRRGKLCWFRKVFNFVEIQKFKKETSCFTKRCRQGDFLNINFILSHKC